jgi:hypothetical protein
VTPGRVAAGNVFRKALHSSSATATSTSPPSDLSDNLSSDSGASSNHSNADAPGSSRRGASSPRLSSKRKCRHVCKGKMLLKPIPPSRYNGEANLNTIHCFARESKTYVKMGRVPKGEQVYYVLYYLAGRVLDFYIKLYLLRGELGS